MKDGVKVNWIKKKVRMIFISIVIENDFYYIRSRVWCKELKKQEGWRESCDSEDK